MCFTAAAEGTDEVLRAPSVHSRFAGGGGQRHGSRQRPSRGHPAFQGRREATQDIYKGVSQIPIIVN